jgi:hypothetical protein
MDMQPIEPNRPLSATLTAEQWNTVMAVLDQHAMPHRISRPIIDALMQQLQQQSQPASPMASYGQHGTLPPVQSMTQEAADNA